MKYSRECPKCKKVIWVTTKLYSEQSKKEDRKCGSCAQKGRTVGPRSRKKMSGPRLVRLPKSRIIYKKDKYTPCVTCGEIQNLYTIPPYPVYCYDCLQSPEVETKIYNNSTRECPTCGTLLFYARELHRDKATKNKTLCCSCGGSNRKRKEK